VEVGVAVCRAVEARRPHRHRLPFRDTGLSRRLASREGRGRLHLLLQGRSLLPLALDLGEDLAAPLVERRLQAAGLLGGHLAGRPASTARFSPVPVPIPIMLLPASRMIVLTSAKSRLMRPGTVIRSLMPCTPWRSTSSTTRKASRIEVFLSTTSRRRSLGMVIRVSTLSLSASLYCSATSLRRTPSNEKGLVMTPTVSEPR